MSVWSFTWTTYSSTPKTPRNIGNTSGKFSEDFGKLIYTPGQTNANSIQTLWNILAISYLQKDSLWPNPKSRQLRTGQNPGKSGTYSHSLALPTSINDSFTIIPKSSYH